MIRTVLVITLLLFASGAVAESQQKAVLITGASSGLGRAAAEYLAGKGYHVYAGARKDADMQALNAIENVTAVRLDVTSAEQIAAAVEMVRNEGRGLWGLVNNAGINVIDPLIEAREEDLEFIFDVNVYGIFRVTRAFAPMIIESKGRIVNISSISGILSGGFVGYGMYTMTKHAVEAYTDSLDFEMAPLGVRAIAVEPGNYSSKIGESRCRRMLNNADDRTYTYFQAEMDQYAEWCKQRLEQGQSPEAGDPVEVARAIEHALFNDEPKDHYMVVPVKYQGDIVVWKLLEEMLWLNKDHKYSMSRDEIIKMMDQEYGVIYEGKPRTFPGPTQD
ncbi:MAG TPA: SDR family oxidoreductase [Xanthomonadales bacterium]|nr:SDR family oxidoreductase [Xanthomonadales bacterium]